MGVKLLRFIIIKNAKRFLYYRYRRRLRAAEEDIEDVNIVPKRSNYYSMRTVPDNTNPELVMFCRRAYEFRTKRLLKMPNKQDYYVVTA